MSNPKLTENSQTSSYHARRRQIIKTTAWVVPTVIAVNLPAHAQSTPVETTTSTTTSTTTTVAPELCANVVIEGSVWSITSDIMGATSLPSNTFNADGSISIAGFPIDRFDSSWTFDSASCQLVLTIGDLTNPGGLDRLEATVTIDPSGTSGSGAVVGTFNIGAPGESTVNGTITMAV